MQPQSPQFFGSSSYVPSDSSLSYNGFNGGKSKFFLNKKFIIIIIAVAVVLISIFAIIGSIRKTNSSDTEEFFETIEEFSHEAEHFYNDYDEYIGLSPNLSTTNLERPFYYIETIDDSLKNLEEISSEIENFDEKKSSLSQNQKNEIAELKKILSNDLVIFKNNVDTIKKFQNAFYSNFEEQLKRGECSLSPEIKEMIGSDDAQIQKASRELKDYICEVISNQSQKIVDDEVYTVIEVEPTRLQNLLDNINPLLIKIENSPSDITERINNIYEN